ncbi:MAG TPA: LemA family protein [Nitrospirae bacterium]|nr:lemA family protein [bacterium BMS3Abin10]GBE39337.1 lemA family protein [bacterium BMS3Bbin08]HDH51682.1 LemA family protein [Nitrospirota bacterium]HDK17347.1 LemA family protein [Nitrospirota bacterium]HDO25205.1 LemA family protein [Nitrospirota bacterium]
MGTIVLLGILGLLVVAFVVLYNTLIRLKVRVKNAWSQIDVQLKRRHDLIPNLVETVKGYAVHEKETLENVTKARAQAAGASDIKERAQAENLLTGALRQLFAVVENYPNIKANQNFLSLQEELTTTENKIAFARQYYNDEVMRFNTSIQTVPQNIIAQMFSFKKSEFLEIEDPRDKRVPAVKF